MKFRAFGALVLTVGLGLFLATSAVAALEANGNRLAIQDAPAELVPWNSGGLNFSQQITFTPVATVYLPLVLKNYVPPLYSDNFDDPTSGWPVVDTGSIQRYYLDGEYVFRINVPGERAIATPGFEATDYRVTVDVRNLAYVDNGSYGLIFGLSADESQFYAFEINGNGFYGLSRYSSGSATQLAFGMSSYIHPYSDTNKLEVERSGSQIKAYINDHLVADVSDAAYVGSRRLGLTARAGTVSWVFFDNFAVYSLP